MIRHNPRVGHGRWLRHHKPMLTRQFGHCIPPREFETLEFKMFLRRMFAIKHPFGPSLRQGCGGGGDAVDQEITAYRVFRQGHRQCVDISHLRVMRRAQFVGWWSRIEKRERGETVDAAALKPAEES